MVYKNVLAFCEENNLSVSAFEQLCGIGNGTVGRWKESSEPSISTLKKMEEKTGKPIAEWLK